jgi:hypothetical protein
MSAPVFRDNGVMVDGHDLYYVVLHKKKETPYTRDAIGLCGSFEQAQKEKPKKQGIKLRRDGSELNIRIHFDSMLEKYAQKKEFEDEERIICSFHRTHAQDMLIGLARTTRGMKGLRRLPRLLLIGLVSEYDVFLACTRFRRHRVRCFDGAGGGSWRDGSLPASSSLRLCA